MRYEAGDMVVQNQTSEQPAKLRLDGYDTILLDAHGVFLTDYQNLRKTPGFNYGECQSVWRISNWTSGKLSSEGIVPIRIDHTWCSCTKASVFPPIF